MNTSTILLDLGYTPTRNASSLEDILRIGLSDIAYREVVQWLTEQIKKYSEIDETVSSVEDVSCFALEISSFLKELTCPYHHLLEGPVSARFHSEDDALLLVDFLVGECIVGMIEKRKWNKEMLALQTQSITSTPSIEMRKIFDCLNLNEQLAPMNVGEIFLIVQNRLHEIDDYKQHNILFRPVNDLTVDQWFKLDQYYVGLQEEYNIRRLMMTKRLDLTLASFQWKRNTFEEVARITRQKKRGVHLLADSLSKRDISDLLVANHDLLLLDKIASTRLKGNRKNVFLGNLTLPNRGGIVSAQAKPWMPIWSSREEGQPCENLRQRYRKQNKGHSTMIKK